MPFSQFFKHYSFWVTPIALVVMIILGIAGVIEGHSAVFLILGIGLGRISRISEEKNKRNSCCCKKDDH
ncbi:MAG: hypothetical protein NTZ13_00595 [Candidatus Parcubacteria bacterium]|nr:hypothetical protein [Candidatus Parcubacteria bacterium]